MTAQLVPTFADEALMAGSRPRLADQVARSLRELILAGEIPAGSPLLQLQLSAQLGVSRTPLREALRLLERDGLVRVSNGNKTVEVIPLDLPQVLEAYELREAVDGLAAQLLARTGLSDQAAEAMTASVQTMDRLAHEGRDLAAYGEAHARFHSLVVEHCGNRQLLMFLPLVELTCQMQTYRSLRERGRYEEPAERQRLLLIGNEGHQAILDALKRGAAHEAETVARRHIRTSINVLTTLHEPDAPSNAHQTADTATKEE